MTKSMLTMVVAAMAATWGLGVLSAQPELSVWDGVYSEAQAERGAALYDKECGGCHGAQGAGGGMAPALTGPAFSANYDGQTVGDLAERNRTTMPPGKEGEMSAQDNADITAAMLMYNQFPAGETELPSQVMMQKMIQYLAQRPERVRQDNTPGTEWIRRLERPERIPGLKVPEVIASLGLKPGMMIADIGAGTGAYTIPFARAVAPSGRAYAVDIWPELLDHIKEKAAADTVSTLQTILATREDPLLPAGQVDIAFFHDVFHNVNDRQDYLKRLVSYLKPGGRIAIVEQEYDDPIAKKWDLPEDRITPEQVKEWMAAVGFELTAQFDLFQGAKNPPGTGMPERWFVVYGAARPTPP